MTTIPSHPWRSLQVGRTRQGSRDDRNVTSVTTKDGSSIFRANAKVAHPAICVESSHFYFPNTLAFRIPMLCGLADQTCGSAGVHERPALCVNISCKFHAMRVNGSCNNGCSIIYLELCLDYAWCLMMTGVLEERKFARDRRSWNIGYCGYFLEKIG